MKVRSSDRPIIILDDDPADLFAFEKAYASFGLKNPLIQFENPSGFFQFLEMVKQKCQPMPELLVLDVNLGTSNGFDLVKEIRSDAIFKSKPNIIMLSSEVENDSQEKTKVSGANAFAVKPMGIDEYKSFMDRIYWI